MKSKKILVHFVETIEHYDVIFYDDGTYTSMGRNEHKDVLNWKIGELDGEHRLFFLDPRLREWLPFYRSHKRGFERLTIKRIEDAQMEQYLLDHHE